MDSLGTGCRSRNARTSPAFEDRIAEIAEILATGLTRLWRVKSTPKSTDNRESSLDFSPDQSRHPTSRKWEKRND